MSLSVVYRRFTCVDQYLINSQAVVSMSNRPHYNHLLRFKNGVHWIYFTIAYRYKLFSPLTSVLPWKYPAEFEIGVLWPYYKHLTLLLLANFHWKIADLFKKPLFKKVSGDPTLGLYYKDFILDILYSREFGQLFFFKYKIELEKRLITPSKWQIIKANQKMLCQSITVVPSEIDRTFK